MGIFDFNRAIVRRPGRSVVDGLRSAPDATPDHDIVVHEHDAYLAALRGAGLAVEVLPPLEQYPDSMFVEDAALVFAEGAILLRPGAPSRLGETADMRGVLARNFPAVQELEGDEYVDGGDVLVMRDAVLIGLSARTSRDGANALAGKLETFGRKCHTVEVPNGMLHLKTGVSLLDEETVLATAAIARSGAFAGFRRLVVPAGEEGAPNALRINETIFVGACYPRTIEQVVKEGFRVAALSVSEIAKLDAGLSCMSLRWLASA
ncbi:MAG TPA: arginine deiminase family protein [Rhizomicrobium sp.]|jgi:dimethylargininase